MGPWWFLSLIGIALQLAIIHTMSKGAWGPYRVVFVYTVLMFWASVLYAGASTTEAVGRLVSRYFWALDGLLQAFVLVVVVVFVRRAAAQRGALITRVLVGLAFLTGLASYFTHSEANLNFRMTLVSRNLGFCAVIANLILWAALIRRRHPDRTLLLLSGGLGVEMAGKAIGHSLRTLTPSLVTLGNLIIVVSYLFGLYVWWQAFRHWRPDPAPVAG